MVVPANPGPPKAYTEWNGPWRLEWAAGGGRERRSRPGREGGGRERPAGELGRSRLGCSWAAEQRGSRGQTAGNGDPASEAAPGKKAWAQRPSVGEAGMEGCGSPSLCFLC